MTRASRLLSCLAAALAAYVAWLLARYFFPPGISRFRVETFFMWFLAVGLLGVVLRPVSAGPGAGQTDLPASGSADQPPARLRQSAEASAKAETGPFAAWQHGALAALFCAIALSLYAAALGVGFLSDDFVLADWAAKREWLHAEETGFVRPIVPMLWAALSFVPLRFDVTVHAANVLLHALNATLIVDVALRWGMRRDEAVAAGVLFVTFPALTEAVGWASGMQDVLMTTLALTAISATLKAAAFGRTTPTVLVAVGSTALALGVKETAVIIPVLAWIIAWASPGGVKRGAQRLTLLAMTAAAILYAIYRAASGVAASYGQGLSRYFAKQLIVEPFATLGEPWSAAWMEIHPGVALVRAFVILALLVGAFWFWRPDDLAFRRAAVLGGWVLIAVLPVFSFFHVSATLEGSRYLYLPAAAFVLLLVTLAADLSRRTMPGLSPGFISVLVVVLAMPSVTALRGELGRWTEAARVRDRILDSYIDGQAAARCRSVVVEGSVDNVDGAYVLRNGFMQALAARGVAAPSDGEESYRCRVSWTDHLVIRQEGASAIKN